MALPPTLAQNSTELTATYGRGVHAYFSGQVHEADRLLSQAINGGSTDPRVYYFRAMARLRAGRTYEAESDMQIGAAFEAKNPGYGSTISRALQRVQGPNRRKLEEFRRQGRLTEVGERRMMNRSRYEQLKRSEPRVLRNRVDVPLDELTNPDMSFPGARSTTVSPSESSPQPTLATPPGPADSSDPFGSSDEEPAEVEENPFGGTDSADDDPFGASETEDDDPFSSGSNADDAGDSFADSSEPASSSSPSGGISEQEKVAPDTMVGILARIALGLNPARGIEIPIPAAPGVGGPTGAEFGPGGDFGAADGFGPDEEDPFADDSSEGFGSSEPEEDSFGFGPQESTEPSEESSGETEPAEDIDDDDPFAF